MRSRIYLASPLGFAESTRAFMDELQRRLNELVEVVNPWDDHRFDEEIRNALAVTDRSERLGRLARVNHELARANEERIRGCDAVVAVLDGVDVDSGTASEIGFAYALGKCVHGLRTDFRLTGDNEAAVVNLQVRYFIDAGGGQLVTSVDGLIEALAAADGDTEGRR
jgi:nucleoside 2-deoxyribosyltransferase